MKHKIITIQNGRIYVRDAQDSEKRHNCLDLAIRKRFQVQGIASYLGISERYMHQVFVKHLGISPKDWLRNERMRLAIHLIRENNELKRISELLGFAHYTHFCKEIKSFYDLTPMQLAKKESQLQKIA